MVLKSASMVKYLDMNTAYFFLEWEDICLSTVN